MFRELVRGSKDIIGVEDKGFRGFLPTRRQTSRLYRVLNEAEVAAPAAFDEHISKIPYLGMLRSNKRKVRINLRAMVRSISL